MSAIHETINSLSSFVCIQWIPDHSNIPSNRLVDRAAKEPTTIATNTMFLVFLSSSFRLLKKRFVTVHKITNGFLKYINNERLSVICNKSWITTITCCSQGYDQAIIHLCTNIFIITNLILLKIHSVHCDSRRTRLDALAMQLSSWWYHKTTSVWVLQRVLRVA